MECQRDEAREPRGSVGARLSYLKRVSRGAWLANNKNPGDKKRSGVASKIV